MVGDALKVPDVHLSIPSNQIDHHLMQFNPLADSQSFELTYIYKLLTACVAFYHSTENDKVMPKCNLLYKQ